MVHIRGGNACTAVESSAQCSVEQQARPDCVNTGHTGQAGHSLLLLTGAGERDRQKPTPVQIFLPGNQVRVHLILVHLILVHVILVHLILVHLILVHLDLAAHTP